MANALFTQAPCQTDGCWAFNLGLMFPDGVLSAGAGLHLFRNSLLRHREHVKKLKDPGNWQDLAKRK